MVSQQGREIGHERAGGLAGTGIFLMIFEARHLFYFSSYWEGIVDCIVGEINNYFSIYFVPVGSFGKLFYNVTKK